MKIGILAPHFGRFASADTLYRFGQRVEEYGFDSIWARDSLLYEPLYDDHPDRTFVDPFTALAALGARTDSLTLGTGVASSYRHPVHLARLFSSLDFLSADDVIAGIGLGGLRAEFELASLPFDRRTERHRETVEILRQLWTGERTSFDGEQIAFEDVTIQPAAEDVPIWGGGSSPAAVERAGEYCDGWLPGRINFETFGTAVRSLQEQTDENGRPMPETGAMSLVSVDEDKERALDAVDLSPLFEEIEERHTYWKPPESGAFESVEDLGGVLIAGDPEAIVEDIEEYRRLGADHLVLDLRLRFGEIERCLDLLGEEVLPRL